MQRGEKEAEEGQLARKEGGGSRALGIFLLLLAVILYQSNALVALGVGVLGLYLALGGKL
jgi:hypothetical protein